MLVVEVQIQSSSPGAQSEIKRRLHDLIAGNGFAVDASEYTPSAETLAELAAVPAGRATIKTFES